ncbi:MAG TPA: glycosyltransferase [Candidatus Micrarchaeaceae archaeon]|nr:glycosyltransferase [Candidatus Micrarchaeaceae archaeon]
MAAATQVKRGPLGVYANVLGSEAVHRLQELARPMRGARVLHLSISKSGTHHARTLAAVVPLLAELGLDVHWVVPAQTPGYQRFAPVLYEAIEGEDGAWAPELGELWHEYSRNAATQIDPPSDLVVVHDPQLLGLRHELAGRLASRGRWVWHCHLDLRDCQPQVYKLLKEELAGYAGVAVESPDFASGGELETLAVIPPVIDPLAARNLELRPTAADSVLRRLGIKRDRPLLVQLSPANRWDDPNHVIHTHQLARNLVNGLQLALVVNPDIEIRLGDGRTGPPAPMTGGDPDIVLLRSRDIGDVEINALQGAATVALQYGVRKGFSPTLLEASWKGRPVLADESGSLSEQVIHGTTGFVVSSQTDASQRIAQLVDDPGLADSLGFTGHCYVRDNHLVTRWVEEYLNLMTILGLRTR